MDRQKVNADAAVAAILGDAEKREKRRSMSKAQRRQADRDAERERVNLELDPRLVEMVREIAEVEGCSPASVINLLLADALPRYASGELTFTGHRRPSRGPRYEWVVIPPDVASTKSRLDDALRV